MLKNFKATSTKAKPEDIKQPVGVSERIRSIVQGEAETVQEAQPQKDRGDVRKVVEDVAGLHGTYEPLPLNFLVPTPEEWNRFTPISDEKKILMADSIYRNGLQQPIVVRELDANHYQILAGNTRTEIYRLLYDLTHKEIYQMIPAIVYKQDEITDDQAREIVSDTNYIQRAELSKSDRAFAIHTKLDALRRRGQRQALEKVSREFNIERTSAYYWDKIFDLIPEFFQMYDEDEIDMVAAARLGGFPEGIQRELYKEKDLLTSEIIKKIPSKTLPGKVLEKLHEIIEQMTRKPQRLKGAWSLTNTSSGYTINVRGKQEEGSKPVLLFLPEKKIKSFMKKYEEFILQQDD